MQCRKQKLRLLAAVIFLVTVGAGSRSGSAASDPWTERETVQPAELASELQQERDPHTLVIYVGMKVLYQGAHIPGARYFGGSAKSDGIAALKKYAASLPKNSDVVLYCGCCPMEKCPNLRPAFSAMKEFGFARLRVLLLPNTFDSDWIEKGYPVQKGG